MGCLWVIGSDSLHLKCFFENFIHVYNELQSYLTPCSPSYSPYSRSHPLNFVAVLCADPVSPVSSNHMCMSVWPSSGAWEARQWLHFQSRRTLSSPAIVYCQQLLSTDRRSSWKSPPSSGVGFVMITTVSMSLWVGRSCCVEKVAFQRHISPHLPLTLRFFWASSSTMFPELWWWQESYTCSI